MSNADIYIQKYKELEQAVKAEYGLEDGDSISYYLSNKTKYKTYREDISYCQRVRNFYAHNGKIPDGVNYSFAVEPNDCMIKFITDLTDKIRNREKCIDAAVKTEGVYFCKMSHSVAKAIHIMRERGITHVPILEDGRVIGMFDEYSVINCLSDAELQPVFGELRFSQIKKYVSFESRPSQGYMFIAADRRSDELKDIIDDKYAEGRRIKMAFVTQNGRSDERLLGIITPWDLIST